MSQNTMSSGPLSNHRNEHARALGYFLELTFNDALGDEEIEAAIEETIDQFRDSPDHARSIKQQWELVLERGDSSVAQDLILNWARQGKRGPDEALNQLKTWYDAFHPLWNGL